MGKASSLEDQLLTEEVRPKLVDDCVALLDDEVARRKGLTGMAVKGAYKTVKAIKPGFVRGVIDGLLDDWVAELEPTWEAWDADRHGTFSAKILADDDVVAERLLTVTDRRAEKTKHTNAKRLYKKLRPSAKTQVLDSLPQVAALVDSYVSA
ncbi:MAG: DUF6918 family protein [Myxococcota bacterium]